MHCTWYFLETYVGSSSSTRVPGMRPELILEMARTGLQEMSQKDIRERK